MKNRALGAVVGVLLACAIGAPAFAQADYPQKPVRLVVPQSPGSGGDVVARLLGERLQADWKQTVVIDNKAGANGIVAASAVAKEPADGYTLMLAGVSQVSFNQHLYKNIGYDPFKDFSFVAPVVDTPLVLVVSKRSGIKDMAGFVQHAKAKPKAINFASAGTGNTTHLVMEMLASKAGLQMTHVAYKGSGPALMSVVSGETDAMASVLGTALPQIASGSVVPVAVFGGKRVAQLPNVPTVKESVADFPVVPGWYALVAPKNLDAKVASRVAASVERALNDPAVKAKLAEMSLEAVSGSGSDIKKRAEEDSRVWGAFIKQNNIQPD
jgi:tripartite-type tricarboxylate transporter receptor subunit TctC